MKPFAVIETGGKQYQVVPGQELNIDLLANTEVGQKVQLKVLSASNGRDVRFGTPALGEEVTATVLAKGRSAKILIHRKHRTQTYSKTNGHRQDHFRIRIESIPSI